jgi:tetratricopeptide (TPR) repeat protein
MNQPRARLWVLMALLATLAAIGLYVRYRPSGSEAARPGLLQTIIDEPAFGPEAKASDLLRLAKRTADELVRDYPADPKALSVQARRHYLVLETDQAIDLWRRCLELDATFADAFFGLAIVALDRGEHQEAVERFEDVALLDAEDPRVPVLLAKSLLFAGRPEDAVVVLEEHVTTEQTSAEAWEMLGQAQLQTQHFDRAAQCFQVAVETMPNRKDAVYGLSQAYLGLGDPQQAAAWTKRFQELDKAVVTQNVADAKTPQDRQFAARVAGQIYSDSARVRDQHGDWVAAHDLLLRAVLLQPTSKEFLTQLQLSLQKRNANDQAAEVGERLVQLDPQQLDQWLNLGWLYSNLDQPERAIAACQKAIELDPHDPRCRQAHEIIQRLQ